MQLSGQVLHAQGSELMLETGVGWVGERATSGEKNSHSIPSHGETTISLKHLIHFLLVRSLYYRWGYCFRMTDSRISGDKWNNPKCMDSG